MTLWRTSGWRRTWGAVPSRSGLPGTPGENPHRYPPWSLREDAVLVRETKAALRDGGVVIAVGTGCDISQQIDASQRAADMDMFAELGAVRVSASDMGAERSARSTSSARWPKWRRHGAWNCASRFPRCSRCGLCRMPCRLSRGSARRAGREAQPRC
ncbi:hypothetical protein [Novosphingobium panipatense]|uniref:hypothetical protein n=1 Tax=Novosphingobium panipatense TaxID=428991 RepID=UPI00360A9944